MRFSGAMKVGVLETQDVLHGRSLINAVAQPAGVVSCLSRHVPPTAAPLRRREGGHDPTFRLSPSAEKQVRPCWRSIPQQESENSATLGKAGVHKDADPRSGEGHNASVLHSIQNRLTTDWLHLPPPHVSRKLQRKHPAFLYAKSSCFFAASTYKGDIFLILRLLAIY